MPIQRCKLSKTTSLLFRFRIAPLYGQYFHTLEFDTIHQEGLQALLLLLPHMPNIVELDLHPDGFERVLDADARSTYGCEVLRLASLEGDSPLGFKPLLSSVATIHFELGSMRALGKLLRAAKSLRELHVYPKWPNRPVLPADELDDILASSPQLEALHLAVPLTRSAALDHSTASPLLRTLTLQVSGYCLPVAARFADSLERLALVFSGYGGRENVIHTFPQVKTLELTLAEQSGAQEEFLACLASINPATYPALQTLILRPKSIQVEQAYRIMHGVRQMVENLDETDPGNPLRLIHICDSLCPLPASSVDTLRSALERPGRKLTAGPMEPFVNSFTFHAEYNRAVGEGWPCEAAEAAASIDVTLSYVQEWFARAKATGNEADLARLAVALERAELERVVRTGADASY